MLPQLEPFRVKDPEIQRAFDRLSVTLRGLLEFLSPFDAPIWLDIPIPEGWARGTVAPAYCTHGDDTVELRGSIKLVSGSAKLVIPSPARAAIRVIVPVNSGYGSMAVDGTTGVVTLGLFANDLVYLDGIRYSVVP